MKAVTELTSTEMLDEYNKYRKAAGKKPIKGFHSRAKGMEQLKKARAAAGTKPTASKAKAKAKTSTSTRGRKLDFPLPVNPDGLQHDVRDDSINGVVIAALKKGATRKELARAVAKRDTQKGAKKKVAERAEERAWTHLLIVHRDIGYGVRKSGDKYYLVSPR